MSEAPESLMDWLRGLAVDLPESHDRLSLLRELVVAEGDGLFYADALAFLDGEIAEMDAEVSGGGEARLPKA